CKHIKGDLSLASRSYRSPKAVILESPLSLFLFLGEGKNMEEFGSLNPVLTEIRRSPGIGVMDGCEPPCGYWELNPSPLEEQQCS
ncbi:hypothetical protein STEG23_003238, partial [Scotinomys teguina]